jgi:hypothetical protein
MAGLSSILSTAQISKQINAPPLHRSGNSIKRNQFSPLSLKLPSSALPRSVDVMPRPSLKRQKTSSTSIPEERQFFKGQNFYFLPNDKHSGARKMRIEKFEEYGGTWIENWDSSVQIAVLEDHLKYGDLTKYLKLENISVSIVLLLQRIWT